MPLTYKSKTMLMEWCLECHRAPEKFIRPQEEIYTFDYQPEGHDELIAGFQQVLGSELVKEYNIETGRLDNCSICHR